MKNARKELEQLLELLNMEKQEELQQYLDFIKKATLQERRATGVTWYPLDIRERGYGLGDYPYLVVERHVAADAPSQMAGGKPVELFTMATDDSDDCMGGVVHWTEGNKMKITLYADDFPDWIDMGKLGCNLLFDERSYREMESAVEIVMKARNNRLADLRDILLGYQDAKFEKIKRPLYSQWLNPSQNEAINEIRAAQDVAIVHGPPGTGKTTTLVHALTVLVHEESPVLVCAPSNAAADLLTDRLAAQGVNVLRIGNLSRIDENLLEHTLEGQVSLHPRAKDIKNYKQKAEEMRRLASKYKRHFGYAEREQRKALLREAKQIAYEAVSIENYIIEKILKETQVVTTTLVSATNKYIQEMNFRTVVIDEAAQALESATWIPILKAERVVLAGDPFQLPPTVRSYEAAKLGFNKTLIEKGIERLRRVSLLRTQYRMNEKIMGFSNREFYDGRLQAAPTVANWVLPIEANEPVEFVDTAGCGYEEEMNTETMSLFNQGEAAILKQHLKGLLASLSEAEAPVSIGVISPYREQVVYLKEHLLEGLEIPGHVRIAINTIDSFQGQERDVIYISLVRSNDRSEIGFLGDHRRMNVAITRAKKKLIIIGDSATIGSQPFYRDFLDYVDEAGQYRSAWEMQPDV